MLSFEDENFISPWFPVRDMSREQSLVLLNVVFIFHGPNIVDIKWDPDCKAPPASTYLPTHTYFQ